MTVHNEQDGCQVIIREKKVKTWEQIFWVCNFQWTIWSSLRGEVGQDDSFLLHAVKKKKTASRFGVKSKHFRWTIPQTFEKNIALAEEKSYTYKKLRWDYVLTVAKELRHEMDLWSVSAKLMLGEGVELILSSLKPPLKWSQAAALSRLWSLSMFELGLCN